MAYETLKQTRFSLKFYSDPGHAWLRVPLGLLVISGAAPAISRYSFIDTKYAYLEEDCDASAFIHAAQAVGYELSIADEVSYGDSPIRDYASYPASPLWHENRVALLSKEAK